MQKTYLEEFLKIILNVFSHKSLYILGAGVSAKYIKPKYDLYNTAKKLASKGGLVKELKLTEEQWSRFEILGSPFKKYKLNDGRYRVDINNMDFADYLIYTNPKILELTCAMEYSQNFEKPIDICPEYQIFNLASHNSTIISMNHDGFANRFINNKEIIINLHGVVTKQMKNRIKKQLESPYLFDFDLDESLTSGNYFANKEYEHKLLHTPPYEKFKYELFLNNFSYIVIIGYSFFCKSSWEMYDVITYDLIRCYIYEHNCKLIIIDKYYPGKIANIFANTLCELDVYCYVIDWSAFTYALQLILKCNPFAILGFDLTDLKRLILYYDSFCNGGAHFSGDIFTKEESKKNEESDECEKKENLPRKKSTEC